MGLSSLHEDLYRMGSSSSPNFSEARVLIDCLIVDCDGIKIVIANGNGFSAFNRIIAPMKVRGKNVWRINKGSPIPADIRLIKDLTDPGHYMLAPANDMPLKKFLGLLEEMATNPRVCVKLSPQEIFNAR